MANAAALLSMARRRKDRRFIGWALSPYFGITRTRTESFETEMAAWDRFKNRREAARPPAAFELRSCLLGRRRPLHGVDENAPHFGAVIVVVGLVSGSEVEDFAFADGPAKAHAAGLGLAVGPGVNAIERHGFGRRHGKRLAIALNLRQLEVLHPFADRMAGFFDDDFDRGAIGHIFAPTARGAQELLERLAEMRGMGGDEAHVPFFHTIDDLAHQFVFHLAVLLVAPPYQDVGAVEQGVANALVGVVRSEEHTSEL